MIPTSFPESNHVFDKPSDMSRDHCDALSVWVGQVDDGEFQSDVIISCWKPTAEELEEINRTGRVWCWHYGSGLQPHCITGTNPFKQPEQST